MVSEYKKNLLESKTFNDNNINEIIKQIGVKYNIKGKNLYMPLRIVSTANEHGPELAKTISLIGKDNVLKNIEAITRLVLEDE